jgi:signal peptidase II
VGAGAQAWGRAGLVVGAILAADQVTKKLVVAGLSPGDSDGVFPGIDLVRVSNRGVAFGALSGRPIVMVIVIAALAGLVVWFALHVRRPLIWLPTGLLLGGALGNIIDRLHDSGVTDFLKFPHWPQFNVADMAITVGVLSLILVADGSEDDEPAAHSADGAAPAETTPKAEEVA